MQEYFEKRADHRRGELRFDAVEEDEVSQKFLWILIILSTIVVGIVTFALA